MDRSESMGMVERVARALCQNDERNGGGPWDWHDAKGQDRYREAAREAIEAMREPTEPMLDAGEFTSPAIVNPAFAKELFVAMIDAALKCYAAPTTAVSAPGWS